MIRRQVEDAVLDHYASLRFEPEFAERVRASLRETAEDQDRSVHLLQQQLTAQLAKLDTKEDNLLELAEDGALPQQKIRRRLHQIDEQRQRIRTELTEVDTRIEIGLALLETAVDLLDNPRSCTAKPATKTGACSTRPSSTASTSTGTASVATS